MAMKYLMSGALVALTACGSANDLGTSSSGWESVIQLAKSATGRAKAAGSRTQAEEVQAALTTTKGPVAVATRNANNAWGIMTARGQNGAYTTYQNTTGQSLALRNGIITSSRGFGDDLMSSETRSTEALISARKNGRADRVMRFLDSENRTQTQRLSCEISRGPIQTTGNVSSMKMTEKCAGSGLSFTNQYSVTSAGRVVESQQWLSRVIGTITWTQYRD